MEAVIKEEDAKKSEMAVFALRNAVFLKRIKMIAVAGILLTIAVTATVFFFSGDIASAIAALFGMSAMMLLMLFLYKADDAYISGIVSDLSRLADSLAELDEKHVFPDNEDSLTSKLQTKINKLVRLEKKRESELAFEQEKMKSLVSDISHQLKTPISNLILYSGFLAENTLEEDVRRKYVKILCQSVERLNFLSESMIKISRLESGLIHLRMQRQSINETVLKAIRDVYVRAEKKGIEIVYDEEGEMCFCHDRNWTAEAVFNLLDNAVKYSEAGRKVFLSIKKYGMFSAIEVRDENAPIPEKERNKIFARFYRGENSLGKEGVGIGLCLAREIISRQGGYMKLKCTGSGNIFSIVMKDCEEDKT